MSELDAAAAIVKAQGETLNKITEDVKRGVEKATEVAQRAISNGNADNKAGTLVNAANAEFAPIDQHQNPGDITASQPSDPFEQSGTGYFTDPNKADPLHGPTDHISWESDNSNQPSTSRKESDDDEPESINRGAQEKSDVSEQPTVKIPQAQAIEGTTSNNEVTPELQAEDSGHQSVTMESRSETVHSVLDYQTRGVAGENDAHISSTSPLYVVNVIEDETGDTNGKIGEPTPDWLLKLREEVATYGSNTYVHGTLDLAGGRVTLSNGAEQDVVWRISWVPQVSDSQVVLNHFSVYPAPVEYIDGQAVIGADIGKAEDVRESHLSRDDHQAIRSTLKQELQAAGYTGGWIIQSRPDNTAWRWIPLFGSESKPDTLPYR